MRQSYCIISRVGHRNMQWGEGACFLLAEHVRDEVHLLLCGGNLLRRRGLRATESKHRHDGDLYAVSV
jgi:hypothetical protein